MVAAVSPAQRSATLEVPGRTSETRPSTITAIASHAEPGEVVVEEDHATDGGDERAAAAGQRIREREVAVVVGPGQGEDVQHVDDARRRRGTGRRPSPAGP